MRATQETHARTRTANQMSIKGDSRTTTLAVAECLRVRRGKGRRLASLAGCPGLSGGTGPRRARPPLLHSPSRPNCAAQAQNWGRMAHTDGLVRAQMAHGASLARAALRVSSCSRGSSFGRGNGSERVQGWPGELLADWRGRAA